jgi:hypothetical protein
MKKQKKRKAELHVTCVEANGEEIAAMIDRSREISFATFKRRCNWVPVAKSMGYQVGPRTRQNRTWLRLDEDYHVRFYKSVYQGKPCYYMDHSAIEYVFMKP